jgi:hypothetical protein
LGRVGFLVMFSRSPLRFAMDDGSTKTLIVVSKTQPVTRISSGESSTSRSTLVRNV